MISNEIAINIPPVHIGTMSKETINGYQLILFRTGHGEQIFIYRDDVKLYGHTVLKNGRQRAMQIIDGFKISQPSTV